MPQSKKRTRNEVEEEKQVGDDGDDEISPNGGAEDDEPAAKKLRTDKTARQAFAATATSYVLIKNLPYTASEASVYQFIHKTCHVVAERVRVLPDRRQDALLGNIKTCRPEDATKIVQTLAADNKVVFESEVVEAVFKEWKFGNEVTAAILVSGFPYPMTEKDVEEQVLVGHQPKRLRLLKHQTDPSVPSYAVAEYETEDAATAALQALCGRDLHGNMLYARYWVFPAESEVKSDDLENTRAVRLMNLSWNVTSNDLFSVMHDCGDICEVRILKDGRGVNTGHGRVLFEKADGAQNALKKDGLNLKNYQMMVRLAKECQSETQLLNYVFSNYAFRSEKADRNVERNRNKRTRRRKRRQESKKNLL